MTIVPAVMSLLGRAAWWLPRWLGRVLPRVDVEGDALGTSDGSHPSATASIPTEARAAEPVH